MHSSELEKLMRKTEIIARRAGMAILEIAYDSMDVETKPDNSPVTKADRTAHEIITSELARLPVSLPMVSEESYEEATRQLTMKPADPYWLIDPLDGTKEYIKGLADYTVNIALINGGRPILGIVYAPATNICYQAAQDLGAYKKSGAIAEKPICPYPNNRPLVAMASRSHSNPQTEDLLRKLHVKQIISRGSSIKMCAVADGQADIYPRIGPTHLWDTAAGTAVAREAGCLVIDLKGQDLCHDIDQGILHPGFVVIPKNRIDLLDKVRSNLVQE